MAKLKTDYSNLFYSYFISKYDFKSVFVRKAIQYLLEIFNSFLLLLNIPLYFGFFPVIVNVLEYY